MVLMTILPIIGSIFITAGAALFTIRRRRVTGARSFVVVLALEAVWGTGFLLEQITGGLASKIFWDNLQWISTMLLPLAVLSFALEYTQKPLNHRSATWAGLLAVPGLALIMIYTNPLHKLALLNQRLVNSTPFDSYTYSFGLPVWVGIIYGYLLIAYALVKLARFANRYRGTYRRQVWVIILGLLVPDLGTVLGVLFLYHSPLRDISPYSITLANLMVAYGLFNFRLFEIVPYAHERLVESMEDGVLLLDLLGRLLEMNSTARHMMGLAKTPPVGSLIDTFSPTWAAHLKIDPRKTAARLEITQPSGEQPQVLDVRITHLHNQNGQLAGHLVILRDITLLKQQEAELRRDQDRLERRVGERTAALETANLSLQQEVEQRRRAEAEKEKQRREMEVLYLLTVDLSALSGAADIEPVITKTIQQLSGAYIVAMAEYNPDKKQLEMREVETSEHFIVEAARIVGQPLSELVFPVNDALFQEMITTTIRYHQSLDETLTDSLLQPAAGLLQKLFDLDQFIEIGIHDHQALFGTVVLAMRKGQAAPSEWLLQALANLLSIILRRKQADTARLESERRFQSLAELLPQPVFECDLNGRLTYANRMALEAFGVSELESDWTIDQAVVDAQRHLVRAELNRVIAGHGNRYTEFEVERTDGSTFPGLVYATPIYQGDRRLGVRGILVDFTERKAIEAELRASEEKFRSVIEQSSEGILLIDDQGRVLEVNQAFAQIYGLTREQLVDQPFWDMTRYLTYIGPRQENSEVSAQRDFAKIIQQDFSSRLVSQEVEFINPKGEHRIIQRTSFPVKVREGKRIAAVVSDITERKKAEREQKRTNRTLTMISECNQALIRMDDETNLLQTICRIIVELGEYQFAWIGYLDAQRDNPIRPVVVWGECGDYITRMSQQSDTFEARCLNQLSARTPSGVEPIIIEDTLIDPAFAPYRNDTNGCKIRSVMIFPLIFGSECFGTLNIYSLNPYQPDSGEIAMLTEMVNDVAFGIHARRMQIYRDLAEKNAMRANQELHQAYESTLEGWSHALELRERETAGHSQRVVALTIELARAMGIAEAALVHVRRGALLHDIGKMGVPDHILLKPEPLNDNEWVIMRKHPQLAYELLSNIDYLAPALDIPYGHHEHWDGSGYPRRLAGEQIPLAARIFTVVDIWDALLSNRPYRPAWSKEAVVQYFREQAGKQLDPAVVEVFLQLRSRESDSAPAANTDEQPIVHIGLQK